MPTIVAKWRNGAAGALGNALGWPVRKASKEDVRPLYAGLVVNWGFSGPLFIRHDARILNNPNAVAVACSKLYTLRQLKEREVPCLEFTEDHGQAIAWLEDKKSVVCRDKTRGFGGDGIRLINSKQWRMNGRPDFFRSKLYTRYFPKEREMRLHCTRDDTIAAAVKLKRMGQPADYWVRSHANGWIFADYIPTENENRIARTAVEALGLDFGAVDLGTDSDGNTVVFEVNTAPGLEGRTLEAYVNYFRRFA